MSSRLTIPYTPRVPPQLPDVRLQPPVVYIPAVWEYKHVVRRLSEDAAIDETELNQLGARGWELVGVLAAPDATHFYFKRLVR